VAAREREPSGGGADPGFALFDKELDADDDELTRTQKVRRTTILTKYKDMIDDLYAPDARVAAGGPR
jgi:long-chain acyl-CoA synthetase